MRGRPGHPILNREFKFKQFVPRSGGPNVETQGVSRSNRALALKEAIPHGMRIEVIGPFSDGAVFLHILCGNYRLLTIKDESMDDAFDTATRTLESPIAKQALESLIRKCGVILK